MNSTSATGTPARSAMASPSAVASAGLVVTANSWPAPPVASTVWVARTSTNRPSALRATHAPAPSALHQQVEGEPLLEHGGGRGPGGVDQGPLDLGPGGRTAGVDHPGRRVTALTGQGQGPAGLPVEDRAHGDQLVDPGRSLVHQHPHRIGVAQSGSRRQRVGQVQVGRVLVAAEHRGHAALGPAGGRLGQLGLGQHADPEPGGRRPGPPPSTAAGRPVGPRPTGRPRRCPEPGRRGPTGATSDGPAATHDGATAGQWPRRGSRLSISRTGPTVAATSSRRGAAWRTTRPARGRRR